MPFCRENPREIRNKAEKQRRDKMNQSVLRLASIVPTVVRPGRKLNKTSVLRLAAHYLRSHQHGKWQYKLFIYIFLYYLLFYYIIFEGIVARWHKGVTVVRTTVLNSIPTRGIHSIHYLFKKKYYNIFNWFEEEKRAV